MNLIVQLEQLLAARGKLAFLATLRKEDLAYLYHCIHRQCALPAKPAHSMFSPVFKVVGAVTTTIVPSFIAATVARTCLSPHSAAVVASQCGENKRLAIARHLPTSFLALVTGYVDPAMAARLTVRLPLTIRNQVLEEIVRVGLAEKAAAIAAHLPKETLQQMLGEIPPLAAAAIGNFCPAEIIGPLANALSPSLAAELCCYLQVEKIAELIDYLEADTLRKVVTILLEKGEEGKLAAVSDLLSLESLLATVAKLGEPSHVARIVTRMTDYEKAACVTQSLDNKFLAEVIRYLTHYARRADLPRTPFP